MVSYNLTFVFDVFFSFLFGSEIMHVFLAVNIVINNLNKYRYTYLMCAVYFGHIIIRLIPPSRFNERVSLCWNVLSLVLVSCRSTWTRFACEPIFAFIFPTHLKTFKTMFSKLLLQSLAWSFT